MAQTLGNIMKKDKDNAVKAAVIGCLFGFVEPVNDGVLVKAVASLYGCTQKLVKQCIADLESAGTLKREGEALQLLSMPRKEQEPSHFL